MKKMSDTSGLTKLGSGKTEYRYEGADASLLERFPNPLKKGPGRGKVVIKSPEFTSLCPVTGQPDFATIVVEYIPLDWCVESKAWKLYLGSFRNVGEFHESCVRRIANDLIRLLDPAYLLVRGEFTPRGGIPFWPEIEYRRPAGTVMLDEFPELRADYRPEGQHAMSSLQEVAIQVSGKLVGTGLAFPDDNGKPIFVSLSLFEDELGDASGISKMVN